MVMAVTPATGATDGTSATFRLNARQIDAIEFVARGELEGESGVKSCSAAGADMKAGVAKSSALAMHHSSVVEDFDELFDKVGDYLAGGFSYAEISQIVSHDPGEVHLIALERWANRVGLECLDPEARPPTWKSGSRHANHQRAKRTLDVLRRERQHQAANVLFTVYGWPDPFVKTLAREVQDALGREYSSLARYTDAVETKRQELVRHEASKGDPYVMVIDRDIKPEDMHCHEEQMQGITVALAFAGETHEAFRLANVHGVELGASEDGRKVITYEQRRNVFDLERRRSRMAWADRCVSSTDAIRAAVAHARPRHEDESKKDHEDRVAAHRLARERFVSAVRIDANRMLSEASRLFEAAWHRS